MLPQSVRVSDTTVRNIISLSLCSVLLASCAAMATRTDDINTNRQTLYTPLFSGTCWDAVACGKCLAAPVLGWNEDYEVPPWGVFFAPFPLLDLPLSFVADICLIGHDIRVGRELKARNPNMLESEREQHERILEQARQHAREERERRAQDVLEQWYEDHPERRPD